MSRICEMRKNSQYTQETLKLYKTIKKEQGISVGIEAPQDIYYDAEMKVGV